MVASWATGKTMTAIAMGVKLSGMYPGNKGLILRQNFTDLRDSTMSDFNDYTRGKFKIKSQTKTATIPIQGHEPSQILFHHADELSGVVQNINLGWFFIEQAEEFDTDEVFELLGGRLRRVLTPLKSVQEQLIELGRLDKVVESFRELSPEDKLRAESGIISLLNMPLRQGFVIANTKGHNWVWRKWKNKGGPEYMIDTSFEVKSYDTGEVYDYGKYATLTEAKTEDNRHNIPADFYAALMAKKETSPSTYRRFVLNSWEEADTDDMCIPYTSILDAVDRELRVYPETPIVLSADPAEHGNDKFMIYILKGYKVIDELELAKKELMESVGHIVMKCSEHHPDVIVIDDVGVGAGPRSRLRELSSEGVLCKDDGTSTAIMPINYGNSAIDGEHFTKLKDEMVMFAASLFREEKVSIPNDQQLIEELAAFTYEVNSRGRVTVHPKKDIKKKINRSPDKADTLIMGLWAARDLKNRVLIPTGPETEDDSYDYLKGGL